MNNYKKELSVSYALGMTLVFELIKYKKQFVRTIYINSKINKNSSYNTLIQLCIDNNISIQLNDKIFKVLSKKENCYVIGEFYKYTESIDASAPHLVLVNPSDAGNLGTIIRSMLGFEVFNLAIIQPAVDYFDPKVIRASMGAVFGVRIEIFSSFDEYSTKFYQHTQYPFILNATTSLEWVEFKFPYALIFGNEATGLPKQFIENREGVIIKHSTSIDSLNLSTAVAIALYEATKDSIKKKT